MTLPWYTCLIISGILLGIAVALSTIQYIVTGCNAGIKWTRKAAIVLLCIVACVATFMLVGLSCGVQLT